MRCPKCHSTFVDVQVVTDVRTVKVHHSILWWVFIGWWWLPVKWIFFTFWAFIAKVLSVLLGTRRRVVTERATLAVCQNCGHTWYVRRWR